MDSKTKIAPSSSSPNKEASPACTGKALAYFINLDEIYSRRA
jgi:hypothetical protein